MIKTKILKTGVSSLLKSKIGKPTVQKSYLFMGTQPKGKINPNSLGYVCPDKTINFATDKVANNYAKNVVVQALNSKKPYEKSVVLKGKRILYEMNGTSNRCSIPNGSEGIWVHGHPDLFGKGKTVPFSAIDYTSFRSMDGLEQAIIYNSKGQESKLIKTAGKKTLFDKIMSKILPPENYKAMKELSQIGACNADYGSALLSVNEKNAKWKLRQLAIKRIFALIRKDTPKAEYYTQQAEELFNKEVEKATKNEKLAKVLHNFWTKKADKLGVQYSTNFENLV